MHSGTHQPISKNNHRDEVEKGGVTEAGIADEEDSFSSSSSGCQKQSDKSNDSAGSEDLMVGREDGQASRLASRFF